MAKRPMKQNFQRIVIPSAAPPYDVFEGTIRRSVEAICNADRRNVAGRFMMLLTILGRVAGDHCFVRLRDGTTFPIVLWTSVLGRSGSNKSGLLPIVSSIHRDAKKRSLIKHSEEMAAYNAVPKKNRAEERPRPRSIVINDATVEGARNAASQGNLLIYYDEMDSWFDGFGQYKGGKGGDSGFWRASFEGADYEAVRAEKTILINNLEISITGSATILAFQKIPREHFETGLLSRFYFSVIDPKRTDITRLTSDDYDEINDAVGVLKRVVSKLNIEGTVEKRALIPSSRAIEIGNKNRRQMIEIASMSPEIVSQFISKQQGALYRIAGLLHWLDGNESSTISSEAMERAKAVVDWLIYETLNAYDAVFKIEKKIVRHSDLCSRIIAAIGNDDLTLREIGRALRQEARDAIESEVKEGLAAGVFQKKIDGRRVSFFATQKAFCGDEIVEISPTKNHEWSIPKNSEWSTPQDSDFTIWTP